MTRRLLVFGASGHGKVVADTASEAGFLIEGWADEGRRDGDTVAGYPVLASSVDAAAAVAKELSLSLIVAVGDNRARQRITERLSAARGVLETIVHPRAVVSQSAKIGHGTVVVAGAVINADANIGRGVIVNTSASVDHDVEIGDFAHVSPGANLGGGVRIGEGAHIGIGAALRHDAIVGAWSIVGAGAVVVKDIPAGVVAYGVPARATGPSET